MSGSEKCALCSVCGLPLPDGELAARCPHCLIQLALGNDVEDAAAPAERSKTAVVSRPRYFGDFELIEQIAQGGMGVVWKARQITVNRLVALKMIHAGHLASAEARIRFCAEIEATARLDHARIVPLFETGEHEGVHYFTMKLLTGGDLAARRADFGLPAIGSGPVDSRKLRERQRQIARLVASIARAVHYAHLRGILHRDLKPSNVLLDDLDQPHVSDFGLAKMLTRESGFTFTHSILGSPNYMAPEQAAGKTSELTTATDVYGLGAIFYELLTARPPFQAESPIATLRQVLDQPVASPRTLNPAIDRDLETICLKCLEKAPAARYAAAEALAEDLERWLEKRPILARRAGALERGGRWCQREPALALAAAGCLVLLLAVAVGSTLAAVRIRQAERKATAALRESLVNEARSLRLASDAGYREEGLRLLREASQLGGPAGFRQRARDELLATLVRSDLQFSALAGLRPARDPAFNLVDAHFTRLATLAGSNTVVIQSMADGRELSRFSTGTTPTTRFEQFSSDGRFLGLRDAGGISIWDAETGQRCFGTNGARRLFCFAPDGSRFVLEVGNGEAAVLDLPSLKLIRHVRGSSAAAPARTGGWSLMALSPRERTLVVARQDHVLEWIDLESGQTAHQVTNAAAVVALAWKRDGTSLAAGLANGRVPVFNGRGGKSFELPGPSAVARCLAFNSDGSLLAVLCEDHVLRLIDTEAIRLACEGRCQAYAIAFDPTGTRVGPVFLGDEVGLLELRGPEEFRQANIAHTRTEFDAVQYSRDGRMIAVGNPTNVVFCDAATGGRLLTRPGWRINACAYDPQADRLYAASSAGMFRWQARLDESGHVAMDNLGLVMPGRGWRAFTFSPDGARFAAANIRSNTAFVFDRTMTNRLATVGPHQAADFVALSPDGHWLATGSTTDRHVRVWNARSAALAHAWVVGPDPRAIFSADGKWLATFGDTFGLHAVGSWEPARPLPLRENHPILGAACFSPDGRVLAVVSNFYTVQLLDLENFQPLGLLRSPGLVAIHAIQFSPDGFQLAGACSLGRLQLWDLRRLRARLREFALDWDWPGEPSTVGNR